MNEVFVDSGGWIACINKNDKNHSKAANYLKKLRKNNVMLVTTDYIKDETISWLRENIDHKTAMKAIELWEKAEKNDELKTCWVSNEIAKEANDIFRKFDDYKLSYTDCTSLVICRKLKVDKIFGFDENFNELGYIFTACQDDKEEKYEVLRPL